MTSGLCGSDLGGRFVGTENSLGSAGGSARGRGKVAGGGGGGAVREGGGTCN